MYSHARATAAFVDALGNISKARDLHGFIVGSHGGKGGFETQKSSNKKTKYAGFDVEYKDISDALKYKLGFVLINACYSSGGVEMLKSTNGIGGGHEGVATPFNRIATGIWGTVWCTKKKGHDFWESTLWINPDELIQPPTQGTGNCPQ